jgi:subtilisin family serine protease
MKVHVISIALTMMLLGGCGGGDGDENTALPPVDPVPPSHSLESVAMVVNAKSVHDMGYLGTGITVGVVDSGIRATHVAFGSTHILLADTWNAVDNNADVSDVNGHGTSVASVIAGTGDVKGIAPEVSLLPVRSGQEDGTHNWADMRDAGEYAADRAKVINFSLGINWGVEVPAWFDTLASKGPVVVIGAGNTSAENPRFAELFDQDGFLDVSASSEGHFLAVGATTTDGTALAAYSNKAGVMKDRFIVAPGSFLVADASSDTAQTLVAGTSFATPIVSAAAALVWQANPALTPADVTGLLCSTAKDMGEPGNDVIYGCGLLDVGAAVDAALAAGG